MKAVLIKDSTHDLYVSDIEDPSYYENELLIKVIATSINRADLLQRKGQHPPPKGTSNILGLEMSGVIEKKGAGVTDWCVGDHVYALLPGGGYAEKVVIPSDMAMRIPAGLSFEKAAAIPEAFLTAYLNLIQLAQMKEEEYVLIHAGGSGVGTAAIQMAKDIGAKIIATTGSSIKENHCLSLGADYVINYKDGDFSTKVLNITKGKGVNIIMDFIGASFWEYNLRSISMDGRWILVGSLGGRDVSKVNLGSFLQKRINFFGSTLRSRSLRYKIDLVRRFEKFIDGKFNNESIVPVIDSVYKLEEVEEAHKRMEQNLNIGKIVLRVNSI
ncbi:NAD(P)H-quinone oxidoreductase [Salicibibacter cibarius]|uniref:NAD(P)H-quinone oxidoreductase n=1 Tax=Salicibibacter cibarius TaxID=2743000 RepID=A0A7T7CC16_9BACI|nr:NAD(P)H-quinone oxidoreductase [Salicibibacter cibarius]QQK76532.1 NAD(P)H-quinone oxidoreductase [Salicibibacter cibarius]